MSQQRENYDATNAGTGIARPTSLCVRRASVKNIPRLDICSPKVHTRVRAAGGKTIDWRLSRDNAAVWAINYEIRISGSFFQLILVYQGSLLFARLVSRLRSLSLSDIIGDLRLVHCGIAPTAQYHTSSSRARQQGIVYATAVAETCSLHLWHLLDLLLQILARLLALRFLTALQP